MDELTIQMPWGESLTIEVDLTEASAPIRYLPCDDEPEVWCSTQYQTADAQHDATQAAMLVVESMGRDWYADPNDERGDEAILAELAEDIRIEEDER